MLGSKLVLSFKAANANAAPNAVPTSSARLTRDVAELSAVFDASVNILQLRRTPSPELVAEAQGAAKSLSPTQFLLEGQELLRTAQAELPGFPHIASDIAYWSEVLVDLIGCAAVGVRLAQTTQAMCPRFHVDRVTLRLVTTYHGPATEFVASEDVDRRYLGTAGADNDATGMLLRSEGSIRSAEVFDVVALKGERWPNSEGRGAVHRSPAVPVGESRVVLTLDPL